jgi:hypothetical protein
MAQPQMKQEVTVQEVVCYVGPDGLTILSCPNCETSKKIDTNNKDYAFKSFKAKCKCGVSIKGRFEYRQFYRKKVSLSGFYQHRKTGVRGNIIVENISLMGAGFTCLRKHDFQKGDQIEITFTLDNPNKSVVKLWVEVRNIKGRFVGVKRCDSQVAKPELGFYLRQ